MMDNKINDMNAPIAHLRPSPDGVMAAHDLRDHLVGVAERGAAFASEFGNADWAMAAGMLLDLGKYNPLWQEYIRKSNGDYLENSDGED